MSHQKQKAEKKRKTAPRKLEPARELEQEQTIAPVKQEARVVYNPNRRPNIMDYPPSVNDQGKPITEEG